MTAQCVFASPTSEKRSVTVTVKVLGPSWNITLPVHSNFMPEINFSLGILHLCKLACTVLLQINGTIKVSEDAV